MFCFVFTEKPPRPDFTVTSDNFTVATEECLKHAKNCQKEKLVLSANYNDKRW